ncbi:hypothetical protein D1BOALGB6SA_1908 [Olavius sp. associated proteobacterium Delta 1]|nr:hypothetical protein D1BOALGB6SA_1908 [Olavius sp. associated proteobacterium Delta 1]
MQILNKSIRIVRPMVSGNGVYIVHKLLESRIKGYRVAGYHPYCKR